MSTHEVIIVGAGPSGIAAALRLRELGIHNVVVLERENEAGGIPRHCGHPGFGWQEFGRITTGPRYAAHLRRLSRALDIRTSTTAMEIGAAGEVRISGPSGRDELVGKHILLATGVRETPRSARLIGGDRPAGVLTTGAFQQCIYLRHLTPFRHPVIIGSELVSFSALLTCRHAGIRPVAMIESGNRITAPHPGELVARLVFGVPVRLNTRVLSINGGENVQSVTLERSGEREVLPCDGVIVTGKFVPENAIYANGLFDLEASTGAPAIDQFWRTSNRRIFAAGNTLHPVDTAGFCWREGVAAANALLAEKEGRLPSTHVLVARCKDPLRYIYPQRVIASDTEVAFHGRLLRRTKGKLIVRAGSEVIASRSLSALPERRISLRIPPGRWQGGEAVDFSVEEFP